MNNQTALLIAESFKNTTTTNIQNSEGFVQGIYLVLDKIVEVLTTSGQFGFWKFLIILFAIIGFFAVIAAIGNKLLDGFRIIFKFLILVPAIFVVGIINKKKRKKRLEEWGEIKKDFKKNSKKIKLRYWIIYIGFRIVLPILIIGLLLWMKLR